MNTSVPSMTDFVRNHNEVGRVVERLRAFTSDTDLLGSVIRTAREQYGEAREHLEAERARLECESRTLQGILGRLAQSPASEGKEQERGLLLRYVSETDYALDQVRMELDELATHWGEIEKTASTLSLSSVSA